MDITKNNLGYTESFYSPRTITRLDQIWYPERKSNEVIDEIYGALSNVLIWHNSV